MTVTNISDVAAANVVVTDQMPAGVNVISATPGQGSCTGTVCNLGTINPGGVVFIQYVVTIKDGAAAVLTNVACVATSTPDKNMGNNCDDEDTHVPTPTPLPVTATPKGLPISGGLPGAGGEDGRLILGLGLGLLLAGLFAAAVARRRAETKAE